jgi:hypothetical protein
MFRILVQLQGINIKAVVDTAAEVTLLSDALYSTLPNKPKVIKEVKLCTAGRLMTMKGFVAGPFNMTIGKNFYKDNFYVGPIHDNMLLGLDLMRKAEGLINLPRKYLRLGNTIVYELEPEHQSIYSAVKVHKGITIQILLPMSNERYHTNHRLFVLSLLKTSDQHYGVLSTILLNVLWLSTMSQRLNTRKQFVTESGI